MQQLTQDTMGEVSKVKRIAHLLTGTTDGQGLGHAEHEARGRPAGGLPRGLQLVSPGRRHVRGDGSDTVCRLPVSRPALCGARSLMPRASAGSRYRCGERS